MSSVRRRSRENEDGVVAVVFALLAVVLFLVAAFVVDLGLGRDTKRQSQNAADAAALAAANALYGDTATPRFGLAVAAAKDYAERNFGVTAADWSACSDDAALRYRPVGTPACISFQDSSPLALDNTKPDTVRVRVPTRDVPTTLGRLAGLAEISVSAQAEAGLRLATRAPCALCVLGELFGDYAAHNLQNGDVTVGGGAIHFNGDLTGKANNKVTADAGQTFTLQGKWLGTGTVVPRPTEYVQPKRDDPLSFLPPMVMPISAPRTNPCTDGPGVYGAVSLFSKACTLLPGLYVIAGGTWKSSGADVIVGNGVTLYFTCGTQTAPQRCTGEPTESRGTLDMTGDATWTLSAPTSGPLQGQVLRYDRENKATLLAKGQAGINITGTVYGKSATLQVNGGSCAVAGSTYHSLMVWHSIKMEGDTACLRVSYLVEQNVPMPPTDLHLSR